MGIRYFVGILVTLVVALALTSNAEMIKRTDAIWARQTASPITLDGQLNEAAWATAESINVVYGQDAGMPGSGWRHEYPTTTWVQASDPTRATIKFLVYNDSLYIGLVVKDSSVGGGPFNQFDGLLMNLHYKQPTGFQGTPGRDGNTSQAYEAFYAWWKDADALADTPGRMPAFAGFGGSPATAPRHDTLKVIWDAATTVQGAQNDDAVIDVGYTMEVKFNLKDKGYDVLQADGDVAMFNISIYDADWRWPDQPARYYGNRVYVQGPWGNTSAFNHIRIFSKPSVTTISGPVPVIGPDLVIPGSIGAPPVIDGSLTDAVWQTPNIGTLQMKYADANIRNSYPTTARYRSGYQQTFGAGTAAVTDPNLVTVKYFYQADTLFLGFDVNDRFVTDIADNKRWDGFRVTLVQRGERDADSALARRRLTFRVTGSGTTASAERVDDLALGAWDSLAQAVQVALALKSGTTIDDVGTSPDVGYTAEMKIILPKFGYDPGTRGDGVVFLGINHFDGDAKTPASASYGTETWFMRQDAFPDGAAWAYMDPLVSVGVDDKATGAVPGEFALLGNYPNPFNPSTTIRFVMPQRGEVTLEVYDVLGRLMSSLSLGLREAGEHAVSFNAASLASGMYNYRLRLASSQSTVVGKMMLLK